MLGYASTVLPTAVPASHVQLTVREALSGIFSSISLAAWIFFLVPQLLENRRNQSGAAVSITFTLIRFASDVCNLLGGLLAHIIPGMIAVGVEYVVSDILLVAQVLYYGIRNRQIEGKDPLDATIDVLKGNLRPVDPGSCKVTPDATLQHDTSRNSGRESDERAPLLRQRSESGSEEHHHMVDDTLDQLTELLDEGASQSPTRIWAKDLGMIFAVCVVGTLGWLLAYRFGAWVPQPDETETVTDGSGDKVQVAAQVLGYASAALALLCRIPQIMKNWKRKSCEGLSLLFFLLSLAGNLTYGAGILFHSTDKAYVIKNTPWLVGSLGTMVQDVVIFIQFHMYRASTK